MGGALTVPAKRTQLPRRGKALSCRDSVESAGVCRGGEQLEAVRSANDAVGSPK